MSKKTRSISVARIRPVICAAALIALLTVPAMPVRAEGSDSAPPAIEQEQNSEGKEAVSADSTGSCAKASDGRQGTASEDLKEPDAPAAPVAKDGWSKNAEGKRIYRRNGKPVTGLASIDGKYYLFGEDGALTDAVGFQKLADGSMVYVTKDASLATGWQQISGACYLFSETGIMQKGWQEVDGIWYWLDPASGIRQTGWLWNNGSWYWLDQNTGAMQTGWAKIGGTWYYFYSSGAMATGWVYDAGSWYYLSGSGAMATGWVKVGGTWYYLSGSGAMQTGWLKQNGVWYWLDGSGAMATGWRFIDGKWNAFDNPSGVWRTNDGRLVNGWYTAQAISSPTNWFVLVDDINTKVMIYYWDIDQWMPLYIFDCSTGAWSMRTVHGTFSVGMKGYAFGYGHGYTAYYYTQIYGDYLFHSILYNEGTWVPLDPVLNSHRSHGCVRLAPENAKWIYDNIPRGTTIHIF